MVKKEAGGLRTAAAFALGPAEVKKYIETLVHSQLRIQEMPGGGLALRVVQDLPGGGRRLETLSEDDLTDMLVKTCMGDDFKVTLAIMSNPAMILEPYSDEATTNGCKSLVLESLWEADGQHVVTVLEDLPSEATEFKILNDDNGSLYFIGIYPIANIIEAFNYAVEKSQKIEDSITYNIVFNNQQAELMAHFAMKLGHESSESETETIAELALFEIKDLVDTVRNDPIVKADESLTSALDQMTKEEVAFWFIERFTVEMYPKDQ
jgi:hypothetical protein